MCLRATALDRSYCASKTSAKLPTNPKELPGGKGEGARGAFGVAATCNESGVRKGPPQKKRPPWWVGRSEAKKGPGSDLFRFCFMVFLISPHRETPKNVIKENREKVGLGFSKRFFLQNVFFSVFELPSLRNTRNRDKTKKSRGKTDIEIFGFFFGLFFGLFAKIFLWCF
jgi:hypothetical protein